MIFHPWQSFRNIKSVSEQMNKLLHLAMNNDLASVSKTPNDILNKINGAFETAICISEMFTFLLVTNIVIPDIKLMVMDKAFEAVISRSQRIGWFITPKSARPFFHVSQGYITTYTRPFTSNYLVETSFSRTGHPALLHRYIF